FSDDNLIRSSKTASIVAKAEFDYPLYFFCQVQFIPNSMRLPCVFNSYQLHRSFSLLPIPSSEFPVPYSLFPIP
ncbi:hypothetical protein, partial [Moorena sp. SIO3I8]|uniref:hypothetical protein n=1 Tax=Moorena sp. SIO3I8 TaxID=2607833 RepID=UPI0025FCA3E1